ncbi:type IV pilus secretin PilQ [Pseudomonas sp. EA_65y_Pfl2_P78]|uniref:type IV pilus secretin PilQ n=1 Tax=Pseudomonas sp. EA_65y_Pfl2_P78 TaxID=3088695 RepID=UPI0030D86657
MRGILVFIALFFSAYSFAAADDHLSFDFDSIQVRAALQLLADYKHLNLVADDSVTGSITMRMQDVSWDSAIDYVVKTKGLVYQLDGQFLQVSRLFSNSLRTADLSSPPLPGGDFSVSPPQKNTILKVTHVLGSDAIKAFSLLQGESLTADDSASLVLARMMPARIDELREYLKAVDFPRKQVMIEARIVEVDTSYSRSLGVSWGAKSGKGAVAVAASGTFVDVGSLSSSVGFGIVTDALTLDLELNAMEKNGGGKVISRPRVVTSDRQQAKIIKGFDVPYQQSAGEGSTSVSFKEAALSLDVLPIVNDQGILLDIKLSKDEPDFSNALNGVPPINTASFTSKVVAKFGQTIALGGVYSTSDNVVQKSVPVLGAIPLLGWLFRSETKSVTTTELMLFLTPTLVDL